MSSVTNSRFRSWDDIDKKSEDEEDRTDGEEELFGPNREGFFLCSDKVLGCAGESRAIIGGSIANLFLSDICHESIDLITLLDEPGEDAGGV